MKKKNNGFTLVEILIVMAILLVMLVIMAGIFNSVGIMNKARDAQRKKDLARIRVAFEEYYNDKGCYPSPALISTLMLTGSCGQDVFTPWLSKWPCDPSGQPYQMAVDVFREDDCAKWFKVFARLENQSDTDIPASWKTDNQYRRLGGETTVAAANYGVSSSNVVWSDTQPQPECAAYGGCYYLPDTNVCNATSGCVGPNCFLGLCRENCRTSCCGEGCQ